MNDVVVVVVLRFHALLASASSGSDDDVRPDDAQTERVKHHNENKFTIFYVVHLLHRVVPVVSSFHVAFSPPLVASFWFIRPSTRRRAWEGKVISARPAVGPSAMVNITHEQRCRARKHRADAITACEHATSVGICGSSGNGRTRPPPLIAWLETTSWRGR